MLRRYLLVVLPIVLAVSLALVPSTSNSTAPASPSAERAAARTCAEATSSLLSAAQAVARAEEALKTAKKQRKAKLAVLKKQVKAGTLSKAKFKKNKAKLNRKVKTATANLVAARAAYDVIVAEAKAPADFVAAVTDVVRAEAAFTKATKSRKAKLAVLKKRVKAGTLSKAKFKKSKVKLDRKVAAAAKALSTTRTAYGTALTARLAKCDPDKLPPKAVLTWESGEFAFATIAGSSSSSSTNLTLEGANLLTQPSLEVQGPAGALVSAKAATMRSLGGNRLELPLDIVARADAAGTYTGSLVLKDGATQVGPALPVKVTITDPPANPITIVSPSPDRVATLVGGQLVVRDEILVGVSFDAAEPAAVAAAAAAAVGARIIGATPKMRLYQLQIPGAGPGSLEASAAQADAVAEVDFASLNYFDQEPATVIPNDPSWNGWDVAAPAGNNWGMEWINAPEAWDVSTGSDATRIAVIDFDNDADHGDLDNVTREDRGAEAGGHGTHVGGTICADGNNNRGVTGVSWNCNLRYFAGASTVAGTAQRMADAVDDGARVINMSLNYIENGNCAAVPGVLQPLAQDANDVFGRSVIYAQRTGRDVLWAVAAGNECGRDAVLTAPGGLGARFPTNVMTVAAIGRDGALANFSNLGASVSVAAPGVDIFSTLPRTGCFLGFFCDDAYGNLSGTSMATPHVAGLAGLVLSHNPGRTAAEVKECIVAAADTSGTAVPGQPFSTINAPSAVRCDGTLDLPDQVDVVLSLDLTGSMGGVLQLAKDQVTQAVGEIESIAPETDFRFAVTSYEDYQGEFDSTPCGSSYSTSYGTEGDLPFRLNTPLTDDAASVQAAVNGLDLGNGDDGPESYGRALWELAQADTGAALGWRPGALRLVVNFGDNVPHDTNIDEGVDGGFLGPDTGIDPGRNAAVDCGGDDIDFQDDALGDLAATGTRLLHVDSSGGTSTEPYWRFWASRTGGAYTRLEDDRALSEVVIELLGLI